MAEVEFKVVVVVDEVGPADDHGQTPNGELHTKVFEESQPIRDLVDYVNGLASNSTVVNVKLALDGARWGTRRRTL